MINKNIRVQAYLGASNLPAPDMYRVTLPFSYIDKNSTEIAAGWVSQDHALEMMQARDKQVLHQNLQDLFGYDIFVMRRWLADTEDTGAKVTRDVRAFSKMTTGREAIIVYESDDDYSGRYRPADVTASTWKSTIAGVDAVIASVKPLGELMAEEAGLDKYYVARNFIHYEWFTQTSLQATRQDPDKIVVMLAGTATHDADWMPVAEAMPKILEEYPQVVFKVAGNVPDYLYGHCEFVPPVHYSMYPMTLRQADILCCSLDPEDRFNRSKSYIKAIEGWSAARQVGKTKRGGCAIIASKGTAPYKGLFNNRNSGLMVDHTPEAWGEAIRTLIEDWKLRQKIQVNGLKQARAYDIALRWKEWADVFRDILADHR